MSPLRVALMAVWGLLAAATAAQFVWADRPQVPPPAAASDVSGEGPDETRPPIRPAGRIDGRLEPVRRPASPVVLADDPSQWPDVLLAPRASVATVIGPGVASLPSPAPGNPTHWFPNPTEFGGDRTFLVVDADSSPDYVKVSLPVMPNGQEGWLPRSAVEVTTVTHRAEVDLSDATVTVWDGTDVVAATEVVTGRPATPTPVGRFYIRDIIAQSNPDGDYGPWILALSGFSETLTTFNGGLPALALHGTDRPDQVGSALSSGCVRIPNEVISLLAETVPLGTPVTIVA